MWSRNIHVYPYNTTRFNESFSILEELSLLRASKKSMNISLWGLPKRKSEEKERLGKKTSKARKPACRKVWNWQCEKRFNVYPVKSQTSSLRLLCAHAVCPCPHITSTIDVFRRAAWVTAYHQYVLSRDTRWRLGSLLRMRRRRY